MGKITVETCKIEGLKVITPTVFGDERGYFMETYNYNDYKEAGIDLEFVQDNQSMSKKGVLRGLHFQIDYPQDKLVRVIQGEVFDVAVDLRKGSPTFGQWFGFRQRIRNSSLSRKILPTVFWCSRRRQSSHINARNFIIPMMRAAWPGTTLRSGWSGPYRRAWS